jgi:hypothetical protein
MSPSIAAKWLAVVGLAAVAGALMVAFRIGLEPTGLIPLGATLAVLTGIGAFYSHTGRSDRLADFAHFGALQIAFSSVAAMLSYSSTAVALPLTDVWLDAADRALGFNWLAWFDWVKAHPAVDAAFALAYFTLIPQALLCCLVLGLTGRRRENGELIWAMIAGSAVTIFLAALLPAAGTLVHYGLLDRGEAFHWAHYAALRAGTLREIDLLDVKGLTTFPSFHTTLALLLTYAVRRLPVMLAVYAPLNAVLIASVFTMGGHYLVDVIGGVAIAGLAIWAARRLEDRWAGEARSVRAYA